MLNNDRMATNNNKGLFVDNALLHTIESFPPLPESIQKLNELCQADDIDLKAVIKVIEADPILYTDILRYSNVPFHGFRYPITSISQSISLFGISAIRGMALTAALKAHPYNDLSFYGISIKEWFKTMENQQRFLDLWLMKAHRSILHSLGGLSFILEIGRLIASYALSMRKMECSFETHDSLAVIAQEKEILGRSGDELAASLFEFWNFEHLFYNTLRFSLEPENGLDPKSCAALLCARKLFSLKEIRPFEEISILLEQYSFNENEARMAYEILMSEGDEDK